MSAAALGGIIRTAICLFMGGFTASRRFADLKCAKRSLYARRICASETWLDPIYSPRSLVMSAYGAIARPHPTSAQLPTLIYPLASDPSTKFAAIHIPAPASEHLPDDLLDLLHTTFAEELERGRTYPQEGPIDRDAFKSYYGGSDLVLGLTLAASTQFENATFPDPKPEAVDEAQVSTLSLEAARGKRQWVDCLVGAYYVSLTSGRGVVLRLHRSNPTILVAHLTYVARKQPCPFADLNPQNCNGGFLVLPSGRGKGYGKLLGRSYLRFAPALGYRGSVFNLVYVNNVASVK